ncbi:MAG: pyridoxal-dependent decarboxylase, exosortase A system-associated [Sphingomonadaceae bacterium]
MMPPGFPRDEQGRLLIAGRTAESWVEEAGDTPLFLYDAGLVAARVAEFRAAMPAEIALHYAVKANPLPELLQAMAPLVDGFDVASAGEMQRALDAGMAADRISFAGPGKRDRELEAAIAAGITLHIESAGELARAASIATQLGKRARVALRVNPPFDLKGSGMRMGGGARPFGVDVEMAPDLLRRMQQPPFDFRGLHIFAGSQNLDAGAIAAAQQQTVTLAADLAQFTPTMPLVNLGGGFGVPYFPREMPLDIAAVGADLAQTLASRPAALAATRFAIELGRWLVAEAGVYLTRIVDRKESRGTVYLVTDGGLHHQLAASGNFGTVVRRNYPVSNASRDSAVLETQSVVGCLCTPLDRLADAAELPRGEVGDLIAVFMAGAYGRTASPENFLGHPPPLERLVG